MTAKNIYGTGVAMITPFHSNGDIDFTALTNLTNYIVEGGVDFIVALGTTAETATMSSAEKNAVIDTIYQSIDGRAGFVVGVGGNDTNAVINGINSLKDKNVDAILSVTPYYNKPNQRGLYSHFKEIALNTELPIILYNVPGRTAVNMTAATTLSLANDFENIIAIKEASGDMGQIMQIIKNRPEGFRVFSGDDGLTLPILSVGGDGVISVVANAYPNAMTSLVNNMLKDSDYHSALRYHYQMLDIIDALFADGNPAGIKSLLEHLGLIKNNLRLPLVKVSPEVNSKLQSLAQKSTLT